MPAQIGDVLKLFDGTTKPPKHKRFICVCVAEGWFFRINSEGHFRPCEKIREADFCGCIDYDSYLELRGPIGFLDEEVDEALNDPRSYLGRLDADAMRILLTHVRNARALLGKEKKAIIPELERAIAELEGGTDDS